MAFEQTQQTRVESKQWSGDWARTLAPSGNGGPVSEPYYSKSEAIDFTPIAKGIDSVSDTLNRAEKERAQAQKDAKGGEYLNRAMDIVSINTDGNGILSSRGEEQIRNLRLDMARNGYNDTDIQRVLKAVGQDYESTSQGMFQTEARKHAVEQEKELAKKGVEIYPELTGRTLAEQAEAGRNFYRKMNVLSSALEAAANPNQATTIHDAAISEAADNLMTMIGTDKLRMVLTQEVNAEDEQELQNQVTNALIDGGIVKNIREARALGVEISASFIGKARANRAEMEKLTVEEKERYIKIKELDARTGIFKSNPELAGKLSLLGWDFTKLPQEYIDLAMGKLDASHFGGDGEKHYWQGSFDATTANIGVQHGTPNIADASQQAIVDEGLRAGDAKSADDVYKSLMSPNMEGVLNKPSMEAQREASVNAYKERLAGLMVNELRPHVLDTTGYVPGYGESSSGRAIDVGFWDSASNINPILSKWKTAMRHIGMSEEEIVNTGVNAMKALGVSVPDNTTNPDAFFEDSSRRIANYLLEHPIRSKIPFASPVNSANVRLTGAYKEYKEGKIGAEEAIAAMSAAMGEMPEDDGRNIIEENKTKERGDKQLTKEQAEEKVISSPEFQEQVRYLQQNQQMTPEEKSAAANNVLKRMVDNLLNATNELVGIKSAQAGELSQLKQKGETNTESPENFRVAKAGSGVKNNNIFNTRGRNKTKGFAKFKNEQDAITEAYNDATTKVERFKGDVMKLCSQYAPREDDNLTTRYCCGLLYRTPGVSDADKATLNEIVQQIKDAPESERHKVDKSFEDVVAHFAEKYRHLFYKDGKVQTVRPIMEWQALMETGTKLEYIG